MIHKNGKLSAVEKFNYLQSQLTGDAANAIMGLQLSNDNYVVTIGLLTKMEMNRQLLIPISSA